MVSEIDTVDIMKEVSLKMKIVAVIVVIALAIGSVVYVVVVQDGFGYPGRDHVSLVLRNYDDPSDESVTLEVYITRSSFEDDYADSVIVTMRFEDGVDIPLPEIRLNDLGRGKSTYPFDTFFRGNGNYSFEAHYRDSSDSRTIYLQKTAYDIFSRFDFVEEEDDEEEDELHMQPHLVFLSYDDLELGCPTMIDIVGTWGNGTIRVYYCESGEEPSMETANQTATLNYTITPSSIRYEHVEEDNESHEVEDIRSGNYVFLFTDAHIQDEENEGNYTFDIDFKNGFGADPLSFEISEKAKGYNDTENSDTDHIAQRLWMNRDGERFYTEI